MMPITTPPIMAMKKQTADSLKDDNTKNDCTNEREFQNSKTISQSKNHRYWYWERTLQFYRNKKNVLINVRRNVVTLVALPLMVMMKSIYSRGTTATQSTEIGRNWLVINLQSKSFTVRHDLDEIGVPQCKIIISKKCNRHPVPFSRNNNLM